MTLRFFVPGTAATAGSKTAIPTKRGLRVIEAGTKTSRAHKRTWRGDLRDAAMKALLERDPDAPRLTHQPIALTVVIVRKRPLAHLYTSGHVRERHASAQPTQRPDTTKQLRAAEDALTGLLWGDDSQIVDSHAYKVYADHVGLTPRTEGLFVAIDACPGYFGPQIGLLINQEAA